jgi:hypothetical protein
MSKTYNVWIEIEEYDESTESGALLTEEQGGSPAPPVVTFDTKKEAREFAKRLQDVGESLARD